MRALKKLRAVFKKADEKLDKELTRYIKSAEGIVEAKPGKPSMERFGKFIKALDTIGDRLTAKLSKIPKLDYFRLTTAKPLATAIIVTIISLLLSYPALGLIGSIQSDVEIYLPPGEPSTQILDEVRKDWPTDLIIICVSVDKGQDITDLPVLQEMSAVEEFLDYNKTDRGKNDSVFYVFSISTLVKELNQTVWKGNYSIPDEERTELILSQIGGSPELSRLIRDTDGDGMNDSAVILLGIPREADHPAIIAKAENAAKTATLSRMVVTGQPTILQAVQRRTVTEFIKILPLLFIAIAIVLFFFHRTFKLVVVALLPMLYSIGITFGFVGLIKDYVVVAPQIILIAPLLVAFAIADSIYIANRFAEEKGADSRERVIKSTKFVTVAIFLTSITTTSGFLSLTIGTLKPLFTIGLALGVGIIVAFITTVTLVPPLIILLNYRKRYILKQWRRFGDIPVNNRKKIIAIALVILITSLFFCLPAIKTSADYYLMAPQDEPSVIQMQDYSRKFEAGQPGLLLVTAKADEYTTLSTIDLLQYHMNRTVPRVKTLSIVNIMKMVKINRATITQFVNESQIIEWLSSLFPLLPVEALWAYYNSTLGAQLAENRTYWWLVSEAPLISLVPKAQKALIRIFYDAMGAEMKSMLINEYETRTLILVEMPVMDVASTRDNITEVNDAVYNYGTIQNGRTSQLAGMATVLVAANDLTITNQLITMIIAIILCFVCLAVMLKSLKYASITILPIILVVAYEPIAFIGANVELSLITMMIASIIIGVGIDFCIHLTHNIRQRGLSLEKVSESTSAVGVSFLEAAATEMAALSAALIVPIASVRSFIIMIIVMLFVSLCVALFLLPAFYAVWAKEKVKGVVIE
ncbi:MAG: MMPL family transporter [Candidatus Thermoplasmatota archaeon]|nr:MMPL family transporter [Candidatus Thermoplasmatota archaeon]